MGSPVQRYQQEMHENIGFFATWLPGDLLELGDIGILVNGTFRKFSSLSELGIRHQSSTFGASQNLQYASKFGTTFTVDTSVNSPTAIKVSALIKVEFSSQGSFLFQASKVRSRRLDNVTQMTESILGIWRGGTWNKNWHVVDSVREADCATVIVSEDASAGVTFRAEGDILGIPLANPQLNLSISSSRGKMTQIVAGRHLRPLYSCLRIRESWFSSASLEPVRGGSIPEAYDRPSIEELLES